jgi:hypothetical protein
MFRADPTDHQATTLAAVGPSVHKATAITCRIVPVTTMIPLELMDVAPVILFFVSLPLSTAIVFVLAGGLNCRLSRNLRLRLSCAYGWLSRKKIRVGHRDGWNSIGKVHSILRGVVCGNRTINDSTLIPEWTFARSPPG